MPRRRRRAPTLLAAVLFGLAALCLATHQGTVAIQRLGPADSDLPVPERLALTGYLMLRSGELSRPAGAATAQATFDVEPGQTAAEVADGLASLGILNDPRLFLSFLRYRGLDTGIEAGRYQVAGSMSPVGLADLLQEAQSSRYQLTLPEGWRREQVAQAIGGLDLGFSAGEFLQESRQAPPPWTQAPASASDLEGFLFPDTYRLEPGMTAGEVAEQLLANFERKVDGEMRDGFERQGLSLYQAVVLASIVEREAVVPEERAVIASVFLNRLAHGIPLQADPTVQYALGLLPDGTWWKPDLSATDLQVDSPFNTYRYGGLPPSPICSPGLESLRSVASPAATEYLFFRAACDGSGQHQFAETFEEHLQNACP